MQLYPGIDTFATYDALTPLAGTGVWPGPQEAQGGDLRSADNLMTIGETLTDRTNFIAWRLPNWRDGGTQLVTGAVTMAGVGSPSLTWVAVPTTYSTMAITYLSSVTVTDAATWTHSGGHTITASNWVWALGSGVAGSPGSTWNITGTAAHNTNINITGDGSAGSVALVLTAGARLTTDATSVLSLLGATVRVGSSATNIERAEVNAPVTSHLKLGVSETYHVHGLAGDVTVILDDPDGPSTFTFWSDDNTGNIYSVTGNGHPLFHFDANGSYGSITIRWTGTAWILVCVAGDSHADILANNAINYDISAGIWG